MAIQPIQEFYNKLNRYPGNNKQWWIARAQADNPDVSPAIKEGDFLPELLDKIFSGNNRAPRGHHILNAFKRDRSASSGIIGLPVEEKDRRPNTSCFFSGRIWYAADSEVYFSQIIDHKSKAGLCYQEADPTSEDISDLIASDGGHIPIPEAIKIQRIMPLAAGVMVFATNGCWYISGGGSAFSALDVAIDKVSSVGTSFPLSIVQMADSIFWWSEVGIHALAQESGQFGPIPGKFGNTNIAETTIQSFYNDIPETCKAKAKGIYDPKNNVVQWVYPSTEELGQTNSSDAILNFDVTLQAFYPWLIEGVEGSPTMMGVFMDSGLLQQTVQETITSSAGVVQTISLDNVTTSVYNTNVENRPTNLTYVTKVGTSLTFSKFSNRSYVDWQSFDGEGSPYLSFVETGYELLEDAMRKKQAVRVFVHFRRTEDDPFEPETSCTFRTKWDWSANQNSNKWSRAIEAYRPRLMRVATTADLESGFPVVISNNKVRGSGKSVQFRFECNEPGKNFDLLGWAVAYVGNTEP